MTRLAARPKLSLLIALGSLAGAALGQTVTPALKQADSAYRAGQGAMAQHDYAAAEASFAEVVRLVPLMEQGHSALGTALLNHGRVKEAIPELERALAIKPGDGIAQANLAFAYQQAGLPAKSLPLFAAIESTARTQSHPVGATILAAHARALAATGDLRKALARMREAVEAEPRNGALLDELGSLDAQQQQWPAAQQQFARAVELSPSLATAHLHLGLALQAQHQDGLAELVRAAELAPENDVIALELGKAYAATGKEDQAIAEFQQVLAREPDSSEANLQMALALQREGKLQEALALLHKAEAKDPRNPAILTNLGMALTQAEQASDAVPVLQRALSLAPQDSVAHQNLAVAYIQLNQLEDAASELRTAVQLSPDSSQLHYDLGFVLKTQDQPAAAIPELEAAQRLDPSSSEAPYALGLVYMQAGRYADAAPQLKASLDRRAENGEGWATLGSVYNHLDRLPEAAAALREAVRQLPGQPEPHLTLATVLVKQNQLADAAEERKTAAGLMRVHMDQQRAEVATNAGTNMLKAGDLAGAEARFRDALAYDANDRNAHLGLARVLDARGNTLDAATERRRAQEIGIPSSP